MSNSVNNNSKYGLPKLGEALNLLNLGESSSWHEFNVPQHQPLVQLDVTPVTERAHWKPLELHMFTCLDQLVLEISRFNMLPVPLEKENPVINPDILQDKAARIIQNKLGLHVSAGKHYMLLRLDREDAIHKHPGRNIVSRSDFNKQWQLTDQWYKKAYRLRSGKRIHDGLEHDTILKHDKCQQYLDAMYDYGTHFVSKITLGNSLLQLIELEPHIGTLAYKQWFNINQGLPVTGSHIKAFRDFTSKNMATQVSRVVSTVDCPVLNSINFSQYWEDASSLSGDNLMNIFNYNQNRDKQLQDSLQVSGPLRIELSSIGRFLEFYRGLNFERILKGALLSRWGNKISVAINRARGFSDMLNHNVLDHDFLNKNTAATVVSQVLDLTKTNLSYIKQHHWNIAQFVVGSIQSDQAPVIELDVEQEQLLPLFCEHMTGIVFVKNTNSEQQNVLLDGLFFKCDTNYSINKIVQISQDVYSIPKPELIKCKHEFELVLMRLYQAGTSLGDLDMLSRRTVSNFAIWIALFLQNNENDLNKKSSDFAQYIAIVKALSPNRTLGIGADLLEDFDVHTNQLINLLKSNQYGSLITQILAQDTPINQASNNLKYITALGNQFCTGLIPIMKKVQFELDHKLNILNTTITNLGVKLTEQLHALESDLLAIPTQEFRVVLFAAMQKSIANQAYEFKVFDPAVNNTHPAILVQNFIQYETQLQQHLQKLNKASQVAENASDFEYKQLRQELKNYPNRPFHLWDLEVFPIESLQVICKQEELNTELLNNSLTAVFNTWNEYHNARRMCIEIMEYRLSNKLEIDQLKTFPAFNSNSNTTHSVHSAQLVALELIRTIQLLAKQQMAVLEVLTNQPSQVDLSSAPQHLEHVIISLQSLISRTYNKQVASYKSVLEPHGIQ